MRYGSYRAAGTRLGSTFNRTEVELRDTPNPATNPQASSTISAAVDSRSASGGEVSPDVSTARARLLEHLRNPSGDHEEDHSRADGLLLDALGDEEVTAAWYAVSGSWWYA